MIKCRKVKNNNIYLKCITKMSTNKRYLNHIISMEKN